jgi:hypothetical protein
MGECETLVYSYWREESLDYRQVAWLVQDLVGECQIALMGFESDLDLAILAELIG